MPSEVSTIDDYIERRNAIQLRAENRSKEAADRTWIELGVANRHIQRVLDGVLKLPMVEVEIEKCLTRVERQEQHEQASA
ncbi:MAG: hypothetical protein KGI06_06255 [Candidatus Micrarchaeota archaeon]|nr:hypothetical protein [Candidatus Micrarchaeota archaeon]